MFFLYKIKDYFNNPLENMKVMRVNISIKIRIFTFNWVMVCDCAIQNAGRVIRTLPILKRSIAYHTPIKCKKSNFNP